MLTVSRLMGLRLEAPDGDVGRLHDVLFEDDGFRVRWLVLWPRKRCRRGPVLIKPNALQACPAAVAKHRFAIEAGALRSGLEAEADLPVSRRGEHRRFSDLFRAREAAMRAGNSTRADPRLQSCREVIGYAALLRSEPLGRVRDMVIDEQSWTVTSFRIGAAAWSAKRSFLVAVTEVVRIDWEDATLRVARDVTPAMGSSHRGQAGATGE